MPRSCMPLTLHKTLQTPIFKKFVLTVFFEILVGCRQGDSVASPLFLISIEILCIKLCATKKLEWFKAGNIGVLLSLYADDVTKFLPYREIYLRESIEILENFNRLTGLPQLQRKKKLSYAFLAKSLYET